MRLCSIEGCEGKYIALGYCAAHYRRMRVYGDPLGKPEPREPVPIEHGTVNGYNNRGCRCDDCRAAWIPYVREQHAGTCERCGGRTTSKYENTYCQSCFAATRKRAEHGTESRYARGCRCDECRSAATSARRQRRERIAA